MKSLKLAGSETPLVSAALAVKATGAVPDPPASAAPLVAPAYYPVAAVDYSVDPTVVYPVVETVDPDAVPAVRDRDKESDVPDPDYDAPEAKEGTGVYKEAGAVPGPDLVPNTEEVAS